MYLIIPPQTLSNFVHLLRADIVNGDNEDGLIFFQQALELVEVNGLVTGLTPHIFSELKTGYLRVKVCARVQLWGSCTTAAILIVFVDFVDFR